MSSGTTLIQIEHSTLYENEVYSEGRRMMLKAFGVEISICFFLPLRPSCQRITDFEVHRRNLSERLNEQKELAV